MMMKIRYWLVGAAAASLLSACAASKESVVTTTDQTQTRVHTQEELKKTGETQVAPALEKTDAAIQSSHR
jgi:outer membrane biogenesis lipoprotein LolB